MTRALRPLAFAVAVAGAIDPGITVSGAGRGRVAVIPLAASPGAAAIGERTARELSGAYDVVPAITSDTSAAIVIGDRYPDASEMGGRLSGLGDTVAVATVTTANESSNGARIVRVDAPREVPPATSIHLDVEIESRGLVGKTTDATATIAGVETGRASHKWKDGGERWRAGIDVVPVGESPYVIRISAGTTADIVVGLRRDPIRVEFYEPRPSWATTFVRRALEADARFAVSALSQTSRGVATRSGDASLLTDSAIDRVDAFVVGGLDRLTSADARALDRFARERGGAVIVVPDQRIENGPARELIDGPASAFASELRRDREAGRYEERLLEQPAKLAVASPGGAPEASELLVFRTLPAASDILARLPDGAPAIVSWPHGDGRLLVSGAMDAWRYRAADGGAFDRFWQATIAGVAPAVPPAIAIDVDPPVLRPGERAVVSARLRSRDGAAVSAAIDGQPIRLVPAAESGRYRGEFVASRTAGRSTLEVRGTAMHQPPLAASRIVIVQPDVARPPAPGPSLSLLARSHHGIDTTPERLGELARFLRGAVGEPRALQIRHPMRSVWWVVPFAACLSAEWWLRRRRGLR